MIKESKRKEQDNSHQEDGNYSIKWLYTIEELPNDHAKPIDVGELVRRLVSHELRRDPIICAVLVMIIDDFRLSLLAWIW